jgi:hypothetical protein
VLSDLLPRFCFAGLFLFCWSVLFCWVACSLDLWLFWFVCCLFAWPMAVLVWLLLVCLTYGCSVTVLICFTSLWPDRDLVAIFATFGVDCVRNQPL